MLKPQHFVISVSSMLTAVLLSVPSLWAQEQEWISFRDRWAILIGVGAYPRDSGIPPLSDPPTDVEHLRKILIDRGGFDDTHIISLVDEEATHQGITEAFQELADKVGQEDIVLFYFSGRGARIRDDLYPDGEPDELDECILPYNAQRRTKANYFRDDEIGRGLRKLHAKKFLIINDSCYLGEDIGEKGITTGDVRTVGRKPYDGITEIDYLPVGTVVFEACRPDETTIDGLFTGLLKEALGGKAGQSGIVTIEDAFVYVEEAIKRQRRNQIPRLTGRSDAAKIPLIAAFLEIQSDPAGASIIVDGEERGITPGTIALKVGKHNLEVRKDGHEVRGDGIEVKGPGRLEARHVKLTSLSRSMRSQRGLLFVILGCVAILVAFVGYQQFQMIRIRRMYPTLAEGITNFLLTGDETHLSELRRMRKKDRAFIQKQYVKEEIPDLFLESIETTVARKTDFIVRSIRFSQAWEGGVSSLDGDTEEEIQRFEQSVSTISDLLCDILGFRRHSDAEAVRTLGRIHGHMVEAVTLRSRLPLSFPFLYLRTGHPTPKDMDHLRDIMDILHATEFFAPLIVFEKADEVRKMLSKRFGRDYDFIVLDRRNIGEMITAKDPRRAFMRPILNQIDLSRVSPYVTEGPTPENMFFGRDREIKTIVTTLKSGSISLVGGRRIGKTSILQKVYRMISQQPNSYYPYPLYTNCQFASDYKTFFEKIYSDLGLEIADDRSPEHFYYAISDLRGEQNRPTIILMDEIDAILKYDLEENEERLFKVFRSLSEEGQCRFVFSGERILHKQSHSAASPLFNFCKTVLLRYLDQKDAEAIVTEPMNLMNIELHRQDQLVKGITDLSSGHPRINQYICSKLIERISQEETRRITMKHLKNIRDSDEFRQEFIETVWGQCDPLEKMITLVMADKGGHFTRADVQVALEKVIGPGVAFQRIDVALDNLQLCSVLQKEGDRYSFIPKAFPDIVRKAKDIPQSIERFKNEWIGEMVSDEQRLG